MFDATLVEIDKVVFSLALSTDIGLKTYVEPDIW